MRIFTSEEQAALAKTLRQFREWVESAEAQATEKIPEMQEGIKAMAEAEAFISKLAEELAPREAGLEWERQQREALDTMNRETFKVHKMRFDPEHPDEWRPRQ